MRTSHIVLAAVSVTFAMVLTWEWRHYKSREPVVLFPHLPPNIPVALADMPAGFDGTMQQILDLLAAGDGAQAFRLCWAPSNVEQADRIGSFSKVAAMIKADKTLPPTLKRILAVGPTKTYKTPLAPGYYYAEFDDNTPEWRSITFVYMNDRWYVW